MSKEVALVRVGDRAVIILTQDVCMHWHIAKTIAHSKAKVRRDIYAI